jgi:hypothetical protein
MTTVTNGNGKVSKLSEEVGSLQEEVKTLKSALQKETIVNKLTIQGLLRTLNYKGSYEKFLRDIEEEAERVEREEARRARSQEQTPDPENPEEE